jgi:hypothetical protein
MMTRSRFGVGVGLGLGALALCGVVYKAVSHQRRQRAEHELEGRLETWEAEGGAPLVASMPRAAQG